MTIADNDPRFTVAEFSKFCRDHKVTLQTAIPGHRNVGVTERRHRYFKDITHRIIDRMSRKKLGAARLTGVTLAGRKWRYCDRPPVRSPRGGLIWKSQAGELSRAGSNWEASRRK